MKESRSNKSYNSRLTRRIARLPPFQFDIEPLPGAKMGLVDYISRYPDQKAKKVSSYDEEFIVAKFKLISASVNSLNSKSTKYAIYLNKLIHAYDPAYQITPQLSLHIMQ